MPTQTYLTLGQAALTTSLTNIYTVPAATQAVTSTINICNRSVTPTTFRISIAPGGAADTVSQYIVYDAIILANEVWWLTNGYSLATGDIIRAVAGASTLSITISGVQIT